MGFRRWQVGRGDDGKADGWSRVRSGLAAVLLAAVPLAGCEGDSTGPGLSSGAATLSVYLTDAPGDVADVWVEVVDVVLIGGEDGPLSLLDEPTELISLLDLRDSTHVLVHDYEVDPGEYEQIRFVIGGAVLETVGGAVYAKDGATHPHGLDATGTLQCPSCSQTGIKVRIPGPLELHEEENGVLLDFDVADSFGRQAGQSGMWVMRPSIQGALASPQEIEGGGVFGSVMGSVALGTDAAGEPVTLPECGGVERTLADFVPVATATSLVDGDGDALRFSGEVDLAGGFRIDVLGADLYELGYRSELILEGWRLDWSAEVEPEAVAVEPGVEVAGVSYSVTGASCEELGP